MINDIYISSKNGRTSETNPLTHESDMRPEADQDRIENLDVGRLQFQCMMVIFQKKWTMAKGRFPASAPWCATAEGGEARQKVELVVGDFNDPASLKPAFASVDEAFVVMNGKDLNRLEANALDRSGAFKRLRR